MPRTYTISRETELIRLARRWWDEPATAQRNAIGDIVKMVENTENLHDAALKVRAEYKAVKLRIAADKQISYISHHTIENMQARARIYKAWFTRFLKED